MKKILDTIIDLQLFAEVNPNVNGTYSNTTGNNLSAENKEFYDMRLIDAAVPQLVHDQFGQKRPIPKNGGKTISFRKFSSLPKATSPLVEGVPPTGGKLDVSEIRSTVNQYGDFVALTDMLELTSLDNTVAETVKLIGNQAGLTLDTITRNILQSGTNVMYAPKQTADGKTAVTSRANLDATCKLTVDLVNRVAAKLRAKNAPTINGDYIAIIHPYVAYDIMRDPEWIDAHKYATPENLYAGEIGKIGGVRFVQTSEAKIYGSEDGAPSGTAVFGCLFLADGAYGITDITGGGLETIIKQKGSGGTSDPLNQKSTIGWKATKTAEILVPERIVRVEFSDSATAN